jgi:predicted AAA+ superfamily ATPase
MFSRWVTRRWRARFRTPFVHIVFGARQTGKSSLLRAIVADRARALWLDFSDPGTRARYLRAPGDLVAECRALPRRRAGAYVVIDEAQNVPEIFDAVQHLYDSDKSRWRFVLCGSSARKLRVTGANLLPGRSLIHRLYPLMLCERPAEPVATRRMPIAPIGLAAAEAAAAFPSGDLVDRLLFGELPGVAVAPADVRTDLLQSYTVVYLQEELRREALVRDWAPFARFLPLAAAESGGMINYAAIAGEAGVTAPTVKSYYQLLEDMFVGFRVPAFSGSARKNLLSTERFFFFDVGVRNAAAELPFHRATVKANPGPLFEQWVGIELHKRLAYLGGGRLHYMRTKDGAEIDFIVERGNALVPVQVKWTEHPSLRDARELIKFLDEQPRRAKRAFIVCRCPRPQQLDERVTAIPWSSL